MHHRRKLNLSTLWIWTPQDGIEVFDDRHPEDCDGARMLAAPALGKLGNEHELCCHSFEVNNGSHVGAIEVFLVWVCEDYELLKDFLDSPAAARYAKMIGDIPPPLKFSF
jgi:hypothetical protein